MKKVFSAAAIFGLVLAGSLAAGSATFADNPTVTLHSSLEASNSIFAGQSNDLEIFVSGADHDQRVLVDLEVYNSSNQKVKQFAADNELFTAGLQKFYKVNTGALPADAYHVSVGIFNPGWNGLIHWYDSVQKFLVVAGTPSVTPAPAPAPALLDPVVIDPAGTKEYQNEDGLVYLNVRLKNIDFSMHHLVSVNVKIIGAASGVVASQNWNNMDLNFAQTSDLTMVAPNNLAPGAYTFAIEVSYPGTNVKHLYNNFGEFSIVRY